jgi:hypothetical protein
VVILYPNERRQRFLRTMVSACSRFPLRQLPAPAIARRGILTTAPGKLAAQSRAVINRAPRRNGDPADLPTCSVTCERAGGA